MLKLFILLVLSSSLPYIIFFDIKKSKDKIKEINDIVGYFSLHHFIIFIILLIVSPIAYIANDIFNGIYVTHLPYCIPIISHLIYTSIYFSKYLSKKYVLITHPILVTSLCIITYLVIKDINFWLNTHK